MQETEREFFLQRMQTHSAGLTHLLLDCPASELLRRTIYGTTSSIFDLWSRPWGVARLLNLREVLSRPHPSEGVGSYHNHAKLC